MDDLFSREPLLPNELDQLESLAEAAELQRVFGEHEWPGKPSRQRLELFLAASPQVVMRLIRMARSAGA